MIAVLLSSESRVVAPETASIVSAWRPISKTATACMEVSTPSFSQIASWFGPFNADVGEEIIFTPYPREAAATTIFCVASPQSKLAFGDLVASLR